MPVRCAAVALAFILLCADFVSGSGKYKDAAVGAFHGAFELSARHPFSVTMVLARYKEDLSWIGGALSNNSKLSVDIYNDGGPDDAMFSAANGAGRGQLSEEKLPANVHVHPGDHLATEVGKYLLYIVDHYRHLPDVVCFAQAGVFEHSPDFLGLLSNAHAFRDFQPLGLLPHGEESEHSEAIEKGQTPGSYTINGNRIFVDFMDDSMQGRLFPSPWWERFSKNRLPPHSLHYFAALFGIFPPAPALKTYSSHFAVRRTVILKYPVAFYMHLVHWLRNGDIATASTLGTYRQVRARVFRSR